MTKVSLYLLSLLGCVLILAASSCEDKAGTESQAWIPQALGGPLEIRAMPASKALEREYRDWLGDGMKKVRLYELTVGGTNQQLGFVSKVGKGRVPIFGEIQSVNVAFTVSNAANNQYLLEWMATPSRDSSFLRVSSRPKKMLVQVTLPLGKDEHPILQIVGVEGVKSGDTLVATTHR